MACVIAIDAGTSGVRALAVDESGAVVDVSYRELTQHYPRPGWVEHDPVEIWDSVVATVAEVAGRRHEVGSPVAAIGITNQRETVVAWDRATGRPLHRAIVWQDRRTAERCDELRAEGRLPVVRERTGLVLDPYFSGTKMEWLLGPGGVEVSDDLVLGDGRRLADLEPHRRDRRWGPRHRRHQRLRTLLYDITERAWSDELCDIFGVPRRALPDVRPSCGRFGVVRGDLGDGADGGRRPRERSGRRPAGGPVRPGVCVTGHGEGDLWDGELRPC